jgi:glycopeptide antibiotics resistance protein
MRTYLNKTLYVMLLLYLFFLMIVSFWGINKLTLRLGSYNGVSHNLIPLDTIRTYIFNFHSYNFDIWFYNTFGVLLVFIPLGLLLPAVFVNIRSLKHIILTSVCVSFFIEAIQYIAILGVFDIDDIILNTLGTVLGFLLYKVFLFQSDVKKPYSIKGGFN